MTSLRFLPAGGLLWALAFWTPQLYDLYRLDGTAGLSPLSIFPFLDRTIYAAGYSNLGFMSVKPGMTRDEVLGILGQPLGAFASFEDWRDETWVYSRTHHSSNYRWARCDRGRHHGERRLQIDAAGGCRAGRSCQVRARKLAHGGRGGV